jgi:FtsP/CotA-like multicopper oxidase with cupredoxin domain
MPIHQYALNVFVLYRRDLMLMIQGQYVDGLRTPLIIHPPKALYEYDEEFTIIIAEWYHTEHDILIKQYISPDNPKGLVPMPGWFSSSVLSQFAFIILNFRFSSYLFHQGRSASATQARHDSLTQRLLLWDSMRMPLYPSNLGKLTVFASSTRVHSILFSSG